MKKVTGGSNGIINRRLKPTAMNKAQIRAANWFNALSIAVRLSERIKKLNYKYFF
jgi:hypothetical protein